MGQKVLQCSGGTADFDEHRRAGMGQVGVVRREREGEFDLAHGEFGQPGRVQRRAASQMAGRRRTGGPGRRQRLPAGQGKRSE